MSPHTWQRTTSRSRAAARGAGGAGGVGAAGSGCAMNADGANVQRLTSEGSTIASPDWSPDGGSIAFAQGVFPVWVGLYSIADARYRRV